MLENKKILVVDDKAVNRFVLRNIFEEDFAVAECLGGDEAITKLEEADDIAAVLLDIVMPRTDGFAVLKYMKVNGLLDQIPVILVSSYVSEENIRKAYKYQVADFIQKPFHDQVIRKRVLNIIHEYDKRQFNRKRPTA